MRYVLKVLHFGLRKHFKKSLKAKLKLKLLKKDDEMKYC